MRPYPSAVWQTGFGAFAIALNNAASSTSHDLISILLLLHSTSQSCRLYKISPQKKRKGSYGYDVPDMFEYKEGLTVRTKHAEPEISHSLDARWSRSSLFFAQ